MTIELTPKMQQQVQSMLNQGQYHSVDEVLAKAFFLLKEFDQPEAWTEAEKTQIRTSIEEGYQSAQRGELHDVEEVFAELEAETKRWECTNQK